MPELWELRDAEKRPTGKVICRGDRIPDGYWHIIVTIWTVTADGCLLLTRRHPGKHWGQMWEGTGGSVLAGEGSLQGALRELREETGLCANPTRVHLLSSERTESLFLDNYLYLCPECKPVLTLQPEEVTEARFVSLSEMDGWLDLLCPPARARYLRDRPEIESAAKACEQAWRAGI